MAESNIGKRRRAALKDDAPGYRKRRQEIVEAAAAVFKQKGYAAATIDDVARQLGTDRASLYYYVSGKDAIFRAVIEPVVLENVRRAEEIASSRATPAVKLANLIDALMLSYHRHYPYLYVFIQEDLSRVGKRSSRGWHRSVREWGLRYIDAVSNVIAAGQKDGSFRDDVSSINATYALVGMLNWTHRWYRPADDESVPSEIASDFTKIVLDGLSRSRAKSARTR